MSPLGPFGLTDKGPMQQLGLPLGVGDDFGRSLVHLVGALLEASRSCWQMPSRGPTLPSSRLLMDDVGQRVAGSDEHIILSRSSTHQVQIAVALFPELETVQGYRRGGRADDSFRKRRRDLADFLVGR